MTAVVSVPERSAQSPSLRWLRFARELSLWLVGRRARFRATGRSMEPTLLEGDHLFVEPLSRSVRALAPGELVVARHPLAPRTLVIKRVAALRGRSVWLASDNVCAALFDRTG